MNLWTALREGWALEVGKWRRMWAKRQYGWLAVDAVIWGLCVWSVGALIWSLA